jgi:hypothetical protein
MRAAPHTNIEDVEAVFEPRLFETLDPVALEP